MYVLLKLFNYNLDIKKVEHTQIIIIKLRKHVF